MVSGHFVDVSTSTMEGSGLLSPEILIAKVDQAIAEKQKKLKEELIVQAVRRVRETLPGMPEDEARDFVLANVPELRDGEATTEVVDEPQDAPPVRRRAKKQSQKPKRIQRPKPSPRQRRKRTTSTGNKKLSRGARTRRRVTRKAKKAKLIVGRLSDEAVRKLAAKPLKSAIEFTDEFMAELREVSLATGYPREMLIRIDAATGEPRNPVTVARALKAWDTRTGGAGRKRIVIPPEEQVKRSERGVRGVHTRIQRMLRRKGMTRDKARKQMVRPAIRARKKAA